MQVFSSSCSWLLFGLFPWGGYRPWNAACPSLLLWRVCLPALQPVCPGLAHGWLSGGQAQGMQRERESLLFSLGFCFCCSVVEHPGEAASYATSGARSSASHTDSPSWVIPTTALFPWTSLFNLLENEGRKSFQISSHCLGGGGSHSNAFAF